MQFCISTHLLKESQIVEALDFTAGTGFTATEVWAADLTRTGETPGQIARSALDYIDERARKRNIWIALEVMDDA